MRDGSEHAQRGGPPDPAAQSPAHLSLRGALRTLGLAAVVLLPLAILVTNPGYFGGDELRVLEAARAAPLAAPDYTGQTWFYRPLSWHWLAVAMSTLGDHPRLVHLLDVLHHLGNACLVALAAGAWCGRALRPSIWFAFAASPLALGAAGWTAAIVDRLALSGTLAVVVLALIDPTRGDTPTARPSRTARVAHASARGVAAAVCAAVALASKENAVMVPVLLGVLWWARPGSLSVPAAAGAVAVVAAYAVWRYLGYFAMTPPSDRGAAYAFHVTATHLAENTAIYLAAPFPAWIPNIELLRRGFADHLPTLAMGVVLHAALVVAFARVLSPRAAVAYLLAYLVPLAPLLPLGKVELHHPCWAAPAFAFLVAVLWQRVRSRLGRVLLAAVLVLIWARSVAVAAKLWHHGRVEAAARAAIAAHAPEPSAADPVRVGIVAEPGTPLSILTRAFAQVPTVHGRQVVFVTEGQEAETERLHARFRLLRDGALVLEPQPR